MLSQAVEDYLKSIYKLRESGAVTTGRIAQAMGVSAASVTNMVKKLAARGFLTHRAYYGVELTEAGEKIALEIIRHHRLLETYLREIMGYDWDRMHEEAEHLEHHISEEFEDRLDEMLGYPKRDPHGHPIPARDGSMDQRNGSPLSVFDVGSFVRILRVPDDDTDLLRRLEEAELLPGAAGRIDPATEDGHVALCGTGASVQIERGMAARIFAEAVTDP